MLPDIICNNKYQKKEKLGSGSFGTIYKVIEIKTNRVYAAKAELKRGPYQQIKEERDIYRGLPPNPKGFLELHEYFSTVESSYRCLILTLVDKNLESVLHAVPHKKFKLKSVLMLGIQLIDRVETLHNAGFVHRDIKPDNLAMGLDDESSTLYMLDLGLGKRYMQGNRHISMRHDKSLTGTARYASMNSHRGYELSRRDDMESIAYVLIYMLRGNLPWQGFHTNCELTKYRQIYQSKKQTSMQSLCRGFEPEIGEFLEYTRKLEFEEKPDYEGWRQKFRAVMERKKYDFDYIYCWTLPTDKAYRDKEEAKAKAQAEAKRLREMRARKLAAEKRRRDKLKKRRVWAPNYNDNIFPSKMPLDQRRALVLQQMQRGPLQDGGTPQPIPLQEFSPFFPAYQPVQFPVLFDQPPTNLQPGSFFLF